MISKHLTRSAGAAFFVLNALAADDPRSADLREELDALRQKIEALERRAAPPPEATAPKEKSPATVAFDENGFTVTSADKAFQLRIKGLIQLDGRAYFDDGDAASSVDKFILRRASVGFSATLGKDYDFVLVPDFGSTPNGAPIILDAYLNAAPFGQGVQLRVGKFRSTIGLEVNQAEPNGFFVERSLVAQLTTNRDLGVALHGKPFDGVLQYQVGIFNGAPDGAAPGYGTEFSDSKSVAARVIIRPFATSTLTELQNLGFGLGADYRDKTGDAANTGLFNYRTDAQQPFFTWNPGAITDGASCRYTPQAYWYAGPFSLMAEYVVSENAASIPLGAGRVHDTLRHRGWQVSAGWVITGENSSYQGVTPANPVTNGGLGAWEIVARIADLRIDGDAFRNGFANAATSASEARAYAAGINWYLSKNLRVSADYTHTDFDAVNPTTPLLRRGEDAVLVRFQLNF